MSFWQRELPDIRKMTGSASHSKKLGRRLGEECYPSPAINDSGEIMTRLPFRLIFAGLSAGIAATGTPSLAWGDLGHEVVCEIAFQELKPSAQIEVMALIQGDPEFRTFAKSCSWPDHPRTRPTEHYVNVERDALSFAQEPCPTAGECVVTAVVGDMRDLGVFEDKAEKLRLLKSLGHWVGDIHQPLHVSFADDQGGNKIDVGGPCNTNLHSVWDTCIITDTVGQDAAEIARTLRSEITPEERAAWFSGDVTTETVIGWASESLKISLDPVVQYCVLDGATCKYDKDRVSFSGGTERRVDASTAYLEANEPTAATRLKMAGIRLGGMLNALLGDPGEPGIAALETVSLQTIAGARRTATPAEFSTLAADSGNESLNARIKALEQARDAINAEIDLLRLGH